MKVNLFESIDKLKGLIIIEIKSMSNKSEVNEIFSYLSKNNEISSDKITQIFEAVYPSSTNATQNNHQQTSLPTKSLTKS